MRRRDVLLTPFLAPLAAQEKKPREWVTAAASRDTAPRVGLIPSNFAGSEEIDGRKIRALTKPAALDSTLSAAQLDDMLRLAVELGGGRRGGLVTAMHRDDWVVIKTCVQRCPGEAGFHAGAVTDPRLVAGVLRYLAERGLGRRFTIAEGAPCQSDALWDTTWNGEFDGMSYRAIVQSLAKRHAALRFELLDLNTAPSLEMPVEGRVCAGRNPQGIYHVPRVLRECDKVISLAPLGTMEGPGVALSMLNYLGFAPGARYGDSKQGLQALGEAGEIAVDYFSFHPADYAIVGGSFAGNGSKTRRHNVIIAGTNAPAVDAVGAAVMGLESTSIRHLELAVQRGYGLNDSYSIWTRGSEIEEVKTEFGKLV
ncbi:MAG: DUF362 domain-containing protein [Bryobacterales bacterium]|nr:DUF362 domain-containing protein [Bryobacterales bacterium]